MKLRRPHVVSEGYLRNFADGKSITVVPTATRLAKEISTKDTFVRSNFLTVRHAGGVNDSAEDLFGNVENFALPLIRTVRPFVPLTDPEQWAIKSAMAMLWCRSFALEATSDRIHLEVVSDFQERITHDREALRRFTRDAGRAPDPGELAGLVEAVGDDMKASRLQTVAKMIEYQTKALERFRDLHVTIYGARKGRQFITSDNPVMLAADESLTQVGAHHHLALGDADFIFLALSPTVGACLTTKPEPDSMLDSLDLYRLNNAAWRNSVQRIACHPTADWAAEGSVAP
jgi:hypothetical protein